jgi:hypothetical protein
MTLPRLSRPATSLPLGPGTAVSSAETRTSNPIDNVADWQITATAWLQVVEDPERAGRTAVRFGVDNLETQVAELNAAGMTQGELVVIADMVKVVDVADPDGNEVSFVQDLRAEQPSDTSPGDGSTA